MNWLDTQTKEILQKEHDSKLSPPKVAEFALVLVRKGVTHRRIVRAVSEINHCSEADATSLVNRSPPVTINSDLTEEEALWGQFELICCNSISVFVRSEVLEQSDSTYLQSLFNTVLQSVEFSPTTVRVIQVPKTEAGAKFIDQFLGGRFPKRASPVVLKVTFKKARMMKHWAARVGAEIQVDAGRGAELGYAQKGTAMTLIQRFFSTVLPRKWADAMRAESQAWRIRCCSCGASRSVWDAGGIRWKAASTGKQTLVHCSHCGGRRAAAIERAPAAA